MRFRTSRTSLVDVELLYPFSNSWGYGLAIVYNILKSGFTYASYVILLEHGPSNTGNKGQLKVYKGKSGNHGAGTADRGKNKNMSESADPRTALFTCNERSERRWRSRELPLVCVRKMIHIEVSVYL